MIYNTPMKISEIYEKYTVQANLQLHMLRVAAVGVLIADHFTDKTLLNKNSLVTALLLHDIGNVIKFNFDKPEYSNISAQDIEYWKKIQADYVEKYGDEDTATEEIAKEIGVDAQTLDLLQKTSASKTMAAAISPDFNKKVACYADARIGLHGIVSIDERWDDINKRYEGRGHTLSDLDKNLLRRNAGKEIEQQIQSKMDIQVVDITDADIELIIEQLTSWDV